MPQPLLDIDELTTVFDSEAGPIVAVDGLSLAVAPGEIAAWWARAAAANRSPP